MTMMMILMMIMIIRMIAILLLVLLLVLAFLVPCSWPFGPGPLVQALWSWPGLFNCRGLLKEAALAAESHPSGLFRTPWDPPRTPTRDTHPGHPPGTPLGLLLGGQQGGCALEYDMMRKRNDVETKTKMAKAKAPSHTPTGRRIQFVD